MSNPARPAPPQRGDFKIFVPVTTRWHDNDVYGHVNNVIYYSYFDSAVNGLLVERGLLDPRNSPVIGLVVETCCTYFASLSFPDRVEIGVRVIHLGRTSVRYELGVFVEGDEQARARGEFTHVHVDRSTQKPVEIPPDTRAFLTTLSGD